VLSVFAGADVLTGGAALGDVIGAKAVGLIVLGLAAAKASLQSWLQGQVTPAADPRDFEGTPLVPIGVQPELLDEAGKRLNAPQVQPLSVASGPPGQPQLTGPGEPLDRGGNLAVVTQRVHVRMRADRRGLPRAWTTMGSGKGEERAW
jgi:hypothetical protein